MAYQIESGEEAEESLRRIASEQIRKAIADVDDSDLDLHRAVHEVRKRCKKLRGLIRLFRPSFPAYAQENAGFRDAARPFSDLRDATSLIECCDALAERFAGDLRNEPLVAVRGALIERRDALTDPLDAAARMETLRKALEVAARRVPHWSLDRTGFRAFGPGAGRVYRRARKAMHRAHREPTVATFHEWRKRVKYLRYHLRLLGRVWPPVLESLHSEARILSDRLGEDHDLAVLRRTVSDEPELVDGPTRALVRVLCDQRRKELQAWSLPSGQRLLGEDSDRFHRRLRCWWRAWLLEQQLLGALPEDSDVLM